jgi:hypothetical protein
MMQLIERFKAWRKRRYWEKRHIDFIRAVISEDARWLSAHPQGSMLLDRYEKLVSHNWYAHAFTDISRFREQLGWCPHKPKGEKEGV